LVGRLVISPHAITPPPDGRTLAIGHWGWHAWSRHRRAGNDVISVLQIWFCPIGFDGSEPARFAGKANLIKGRKAF
jgi:hypothetical protein